MTTRLDTPGPTQRLLLEVLTIAAAGDHPWLAGKEIAYAAGIPEGSVYGSTSGMQNFHLRGWVVYEDRAKRPGGNTRRFFRITPDGMAALLKLKRDEDDDR